MDRLTGDVEELRTQLSQAEVSRQQAQEQLEEMSATNKSLEVSMCSGVCISIYKLKVFIQTLSLFIWGYCVCLKVDPCNWLCLYVYSCL